MAFLRISSRKFWLLQSVLLFLLIFPNLINHKIPGLRSPESGLYVSNRMWFDTCFYTGVMQDEEERVYVLTTSNILVKFEEDGSKRFYHLEGLAPFQFNVVDGNIQVYHDGFIYEYNQDGEFLQKYESQPIVSLRGYKSVERNGLRYERSGDGLPWIASIQAYRTDSATDLGSTVLWSFTPIVGKKVTTVLSVLYLFTLTLFFMQTHREKKRKAEENSALPFNSLHSS